MGRKSPCLVALPDWADLPAEGVQFFLRQGMIGMLAKERPQDSLRLPLLVDLNIKVGEIQIRLIEAWGHTDTLLKLGNRLLGISQHHVK